MTTACHLLLPRPPEVATPRVMAAVTGSLYCAGGSVVLAAGAGRAARSPRPWPACWPSGCCRSSPGWPACAGAAAGPGRLPPPGRRRHRPHRGRLAAGRAPRHGHRAGRADGLRGAGLVLLLRRPGGRAAAAGGDGRRARRCCVVRPDVPGAVPVALCLVCVAVAVVVGALVRRASSAGQDPLTGLANRRGFDEAVERLLQLCARTGTPLSAALLDIDHFKAVNDTHGHAAGDDLLRLVADRWSPALPAGAVLARHGGDEFSLLLPDTAGPVALAVVEQLRDAVPEVGLSCGVTAAAARGDGVAADAPGRPGALPGQGRRPGPQRARRLRPGPAGRRPRGRAGRGPGRRWPPGPLPGDRHPRRRRRRRRGGAGPLGAPDPRPALPGPVRAAGRADRADRGAGRPRAAHGLRGPGRAARPHRPPAAAHRERLGPPAVRPGLPRPGRRGAGRHRVAGRVHGARGDREPARGGVGRRGGRPGDPARAGAVGGHRRLRDRLLLAGPAGHAAGGLPQAGPLVRLGADHARRGGPG